MKDIEAVVFDLFGTLVHEFPAAEFHEAVRSVGAALGLDPEAFREGWEATSIGRQTGEFLDVEENVRMICLAFGMMPVVGLRDTPLLAGNVSTLRDLPSTVCIAYFVPG